MNWNLKSPQLAKSGAKHSPGPLPEARLIEPPAITGTNPACGYVV
jgi:hypothetical protein